MDTKATVEHASYHHDGASSASPSETDAATEDSARRKIDLRLMPILTLVYLFAFIDRSNAGNARILGMDEDLELDSYRFNIALTCFYVPYIVFEVPANIMCKILGPKIWIPILTVSFGIIVACMATVQSYEGFLVARAFLGLAEAGIMPGITYTLSCFYRRRSLISRVGLYSSFASLSGAFGGLLATAFSRVPPFGILHTWRHIFFFEGLISALIGIAAFFVLPSSIDAAPFLTPEEKAVTAARISDDMRSQSVERLELRYVRRAVLNGNTVLLAVASLCSLTTMNSMALFTPSILRAMGYSGVDSQLMSVPPYVWAAAVCVSVTLMSDRTNVRGPWILGVMPVTVVGFVLLLATEKTGVRYFALFLCLTGAFTASPMLVAWSIDNTAGHMTRAVASAAVVGFGNFGGIVAAWTYVLPDAPRYVKGHGLNLGVSSFCIIVVALAILNLHRENKLKRAGRRDDRVAGKTDREVQDLGHTHPEFYFTL